MNYDGRNTYVGFEVAVVRTKAGHIGQVMVGPKIVWESYPCFDAEESRSYDAARNAALDKVGRVMESLFSASETVPDYNEPF